MAAIISQDASIKSFNALLRDFRPELLLASKFTSDSGYYTEISKLYSTMFHEWSALQKDVSDTMEAVSALEWTITPYTDTGSKPTAEAQAAADTVRRALWHAEAQAPGSYAHCFTEMAGAMLDAIYRGASVHEIIWQRTADLVYPAEYRQIAPQYYVWETRTGHKDRLLMVKDGTSYCDPEPFPEHKFIIALNTIGSDHPIFNAVFYSLIGYFVADKFGLPWLHQYCKRYGHPVMKFQCNTEEDIAKLKQQLKESEDLYSVFLLNEGDMDVTAMPSGASIPHETLLRIAENACHQAILGQTLTSDTSQNGGSRAQAEVHLGVQKSIVMKRAEYVARVLNRQLIPAIIAMNYGSTQSVPIPELKFAIPDDGANIDRAEFWGKVLALPGVTVPRETVYESLRIPIPQEGDDTLGGSSPAPQQEEAENVKKNASADDGVKAARSTGSLGGEGELLAELTMREYLRPLAAALKEAKERGESYADIKKRLAAPLTNAAALAHGLAAAFNAGRLLPQGEDVAAANPYGCNQYGEGWAEPHDGNSTSYQKMGPGKPARKVLTTEHGGNKVEKVTHDKHPGKDAYEHADNDSLDKTAKEEREKREKEKAAKNTSAGVDAFSEKLEKNVDKATAERFREQMANAPEEARALFEKYKGEIEISSKTKGVSCCWRGIPPKVELNKQHNSLDNRWCVPNGYLMHELGHALDIHAGGGSLVNSPLSSKLQEAIDTDVKEAFERKRKELETKSGRKMRKNEIRYHLAYELNALDAGLAAVTDAYGANGVFAALKHSPSYFKQKPYAGRTETFANLYEAHVLQDKKMIDAARKYLPRTYDRFIAILKEHTKGEKS